MSISAEALERRELQAESDDDTVAHLMAQDLGIFMTSGQRGRA